MNIKIFTAILTLLIFSGSLVAQTADSDWPQILGANRNGISTTTETLGWSGEPKVTWDVEVGEGFAGPVVADGALILFHRPKGRGKLVVQKFDVTDGKTIWKTKLTSRYQAKMDGDSGPKATPVIDNGFVYCHGPGGELASVNFESGEIAWEINAREMFNAASGYFGCGSSPIVVDGKVILNVGGKAADNKGAAVVAFDAASGKVVWSSVKDTASYSSPIVVEHNGKKLAIVLTRTKFVGLDVATGEVQFSNSFGVRGPTAVGSMPVAFGSKLFANAAYNVGSTVIDLNNLRKPGSNHRSCDGKIKMGQVTFPRFAHVADRRSIAGLRLPRKIDADQGIARQVYGVPNCDRV